MIHTSRCILVAAGLSSFLLAGITSAETWTDTTGKFKVEAEYVSVDGKSVVLRKADGTTLNVPIDRLSPESRAQAKRMYDMAKSGAGSSPATVLEPTSPSAAVPAISANSGPLNFTPPTSPSVPPMPAFPENASLQETVDFVRAQFLAGHPEVFWYALPGDVRTTIDSEQMRNTMVPAIKAQAQTNKKTEGVVMKAIEALITKKEFVLNSPLMGQVPPPMMQSVQQGYDPAVGTIYELAKLSFDTESLEKMTITQFLDDHGPKIGGHLQELAKLAPPGMIDGVLAKVTVEQTSDTVGTITAPNKEGGTETTEMVQYLGRWVPKNFADGWESNKEAWLAEITEKMNAAQQNPEAAKQAEAMVGVFVTMANGVLDPILAANTQQEFDQAVMQVIGMIGMMGGGPGGAPGGPGGTPGGPGAAPGGPGAGQGGLELNLE